MSVRQSLKKGLSYLNPLAYMPVSKQQAIKKNEQQLKNVTLQLNILNRELDMLEKENSYGRLYDNIKNKIDVLIQREFELARQLLSKINPQYRKSTKKLPKPIEQQQIGDWQDVTPLRAMQAFHEGLSNPAKRQLQNSPTHKLHMMSYAVTQQQRDRARGLQQPQINRREARRKQDQSRIRTIARTRQLPINKAAIRMQQGRLLKPQNVAKWLEQQGQQGWMLDLGKKVDQTLKQQGYQRQQQK